MPDVRRYVVGVEKEDWHVRDRAALQDARAEIFELRAQLAAQRNGQE